MTKKICPSLVMLSGLCGLVLISVQPARGQESDLPNSKKEEYFHRIYKTYNEQPTSEEEWEQTVGERQSQIYRVQKGDTLSDISRTFFGDPSYWPKIWSINSSNITNPHEIDPLMNIQFFPGSMTDAPTLNLAEASTSPGAAATPETTSVALPKPAAKPAVLKNLPSSIPVYRYGKVLIPPVSVTIDGRQPNFTNAPEHLSYYVSDVAPVPRGTVEETELGLNSASEYQYVVVKLSEASQKNYVVYRELPGVTDPQQIDKNIKAHLIEYQGALEILEKVNEGENLYRAIVKKTIFPLQVGAKLLPGTLPMFDPSPSPVSTGGQALIIGGPFASQRELIGHRSLVFLNNGSSGGFQEGQSLPIFKNLRKRNPASKSLGNDRQIGAVKIVKVSGAYITAYVTSALDDIMIGDYVGNNASMSASVQGTDDFEATAAEKVPSPAPEEGGLDEELDF